MKATKKLFGAVALSAALAMGTAIPAFAAPAAGEVTDGTHGASAVQAGTANTVINVKTTNTQIDVAVPLKVLFNAESAGGALGAPSAGAYKIKNYSAAPVYVTKADVAYADSNPNGKYWQVTSSAIKDGQQPTNQGDADFLGDLNIKVSYTPVKFNTSQGTATSGTKVENKAITPDTPIWEVGNATYIEKATSDTAPGEFIIDWSGTSSVLNKVSTTGADAIKVTYTVSTNSAIDTATDELTQ